MLVAGTGNSVYAGTYKNGINYDNNTLDGCTNKILLHSADAQ